MCPPVALKWISVFLLGIALLLTVAAVLLPGWGRSRSYGQGLFHSKCVKEHDHQPIDRYFLKACKRIVLRPTRVRVIVRSLLLVALLFILVSLVWTTFSCCLSCIAIPFFVIGIFIGLSGVFNLAGAIIFSLNNYPKDLQKDIINRYHRISNFTVYNSTELEYLTEIRSYYCMNITIFSGCLLLVISVLSFTIQKASSEEEDE